MATRTIFWKASGVSEAPLVDLCIFEKNPEVTDVIPSFPFPAEPEQGERPLLVSVFQKSYRHGSDTIRENIPSQKKGIKA